MKYILIFLTFLTFSAAFAQGTTKKEVYCDKTETVISDLKGRDYQEDPIWLGKEKDSKMPNYMLFVNHETKSWTIIQFNNEFACVLGIGKGYNTIAKKPYI